MNSDTPRTDAELIRMVGTQSEGLYVSPDFARELEREVARLQAKPKELYHCTTQKKAKGYRETGHIIAPVRGFDTMAAALAWCVKTGRTVIYRIPAGAEFCHKLPDHHNRFGSAWWLDKNVENFTCVFSAESDA